MPDASWGYTAEEGLKGVLGGENIDKINRREGAMSPAEMRTYIENAPNEENDSYSDECRRFAKAILEKAELNEDFKELFILDSHKFAYNVIDDSNYDLTGFMFGWAVNAVRYVLNEPAIQNPAIVEF